jgi:molybdopterin molybdotransferase
MSLRELMLADLERALGIVHGGDELVPPGTEPGPGQIVHSNAFTMAAVARREGAEVIDLGILPDRLDETIAGFRRARDLGADMLVTAGGASVGDYDLVQPALAAEGVALSFWKIAMRPGKPLIFGRLQETPLLGLPGNPVSAMVCSLLFLAPAIAAMLGTAYSLPIIKARLASSLGANGKRQDYIRVKLSRVDGVPVAQPFNLQDSSMQKVFAHANALVVRRPYAPPANAGDDVDVLLLDN